jgi:hypothetical protein
MSESPPGPRQRLLSLRGLAPFLRPHRPLLVGWLLALALSSTSTLFFLCILYLAVLSLNYSVRLSDLTRQVKDLAQELALLRGEREGCDPGHSRE